MIVAGLDQDYLGKPFEPMPQLLAIAEYITKTHAICMVCGNPANHTQRLVASGDRVLLGAHGPLRGALPALLRSASVADSARVRDPAFRSRRKKPPRHLGLTRAPRLNNNRSDDSSGVGALDRLAGAAAVAAVRLGFLVANIRLGALLWAYRRRERSALLVWQGAKPTYYGFSLALGVMLGLLLVIEAFVLKRSPRSMFGEAMMFIYYGYMFPLSTRIAPGFYGDGVWSDSGFMNWSADLGGVVEGRAYASRWC